MKLINPSNYTCYNDFIVDIQRNIDDHLKMLRTNRQLAADGNAIGVVDQISKEFRPYTVEQIDEFIKEYLENKFDPHNPESIHAQTIVDELVEYNYPIPELKWDESKRKITLGFFATTHELIISCVGDKISYTAYKYANDKESSNESATVEEAVDSISVFFHGEAEVIDFAEYL